MTIDEQIIQNNHQQTLEQLVKIPPGLYSLSKPNRKWYQKLFKPDLGYLDVQINKHKDRVLTYTSHRDHHVLTEGPSKIFHLAAKEDGSYELKCYFKTIRSLHLIWGLGQGGINQLAEGIDSCISLLQQYKNTRH